MQEEKGQAVVLVAIALVALLALTGLAIDGGQLFALRRSAQNAADAAALAGVRELANVVARCQSGSAANDQKVWNAVVQFAVQNGVRPEAGDEIAASYIDRNERYLGPVGSGYIPTGATGVTVVLTATRSTYFLQVVGEAQMRAAAKAVAMSGPVTSSPAAFYPSPCPCRWSRHFLPTSSLWS